jgi:Cell wall-active antibiotics response 4TMS YvqF
MTTTQPQALRPRMPGGPPGRGVEPGRVMLGLLLIGWGAGWLLDAADVVEIPIGALAAGTLIAVGLVLMLDAGRHANAGLLVLGIALTAALAVFSIPAGLDLDPGAGVGDRLVRPISAAELATTYRLDAGNLTVDLRDAILPEVGVTTVAASVGVGQLVVRVPPGVPLEVHGQVGTGQVQALGRTESGVDVDTVMRDETGDGSRLLLDLRVGLGEIEVQR